MKKIALALIAVFTIAVLFSCRSHHRCAAYSKVEHPSSQKPS